MAGITHRVSTSSFKPLSLEEIMMVPLAKRKMEDDFLANTDKINELEASTLSPDSEEAQAILGGMKERAGALSDDILKRGFSRGQMNKLRGLRSEVTKEYGSEGFLGNAIANKKAFAAYSQNLLKNKDNRGGYSAAEAQQWAGSQLQGFKTKNDDGSFNSFSGKQIHDRYDYDKFLKDAAANIASDGRPAFDGGLAVLKNQGLPAFKQLFVSGNIEKKDYNKIMSSIVSQAQGNPNLLKSLQQEAFFTGEKTPLDLGRMGNFKRDANGKIIPGSREWITGDSFFGRRIAGLAQGAAFNKLTTSQKIITDEFQLKLQSEGIKAKDVGAAVSLMNGELEEIIPESLDDVRDGIKVSEEKLAEYKQRLDSYPKEEKTTIDEKGNTIPSRDYEMLQNLYSTTSSKLKNAKSHLEAAEVEVKKSLTSSQIELLKAGDILDKNSYDLIKVGRELGIEDMDSYEESENQEGGERGGYIAKQKLDKKMELGEKIMSKLGFPGKKLRDISEVKRFIEEETKKEIVSNSEKYQIKLLAGNKGIVGETNKRLTESFNEGSYSYAYDNNESLKDIKQSLIEEDDDRKIGVKVTSTSSLNREGHPIEQVTFFDKETGVDLKVVSATRGYDGMSDFLKNARAMSNSSDPLIQERGMKMFVNSKIMPALVSSGINGNQKEGVISNWTVKGKDGENKSLGWTKEVGGSGSEIIRITVDGVPMSNQFLSEQEVANALYKILPK